MPARSFECPETEQLCEDERCTRTACTRQRETAERAAKLASDEREAETYEYSKHIEKFARELLKNKGISRPTEYQLAKVMRLPKVIDEGIRRGRWSGD